MDDPLDDLLGDHGDKPATINPDSPHYSIGTESLHPISYNGKDILFPFPEPRSGQIETIDACHNSLLQGNAVLLCAGTGFGKSPTVMGLARLFESAWVIVGGRDLVEQYKRDFEKYRDYGFMKSRQSFGCTVCPGQTCAEAAQTCARIRTNALNNFKDNQKFELDGVLYGEREFKATFPCHYSQNKQYALNKPVTIMTTAMALTLFTYMAGAENINERQLLVVDESSELENELLKFYQYKINTDYITKVLGKTIFTPDANGEIMVPKPAESLESCIEWMAQVSVIVQERINKINEVVNGNTDLLDQTTSNTLDRLDSIVRGISAARKGVEMGIPYSFEINPGKTIDDYEINVFPLEARTLFEQTMGQFAEHWIFCSATTGPADLFRSTHGFDRPVQYIEAGTPFPSQNRPVYALPVASLAYRQIHEGLPIVCKKIAEIAQGDFADPAMARFCHAKQKGVIHTVNNRVTDAVVEALSDAGLKHRVVVMRGSGPQRAMAMERFVKSDKPLILVSPSAHIGISLPDDMARWQVVAKTPYASLGDKSVVHRKEFIQGWYSWQTTKDLIQAAGRIVRSPEDWGITYILDSTFCNHYKYNAQQFPTYIAQAIRIIERKTPPPPSKPPVIGR